MSRSVPGGLDYSDLPPDERAAKRFPHARGHVRHPEKDRLMAENGPTHRCLVCGVTVKMHEGDEFPRDTEICSHEWEEICPT